jgi:hypothetical protein
MTSPIERLRGWIGSLFDGDDRAPADGSGRPVDGNAGDRSKRRVSGEATSSVAHRDDRPLETPTDLDPSSPSASRIAPATDPDSVEIPDADAVASEAAGRDLEVDGPSAAGGSRRSPSSGDASDAPLACSVCGTAVEEPDAPCPLCRSTDVAPVTDTAVGNDGRTRAGRTAASRTEDEAVDRLRDLRNRDG